MSNTPRTSNDDYLVKIATETVYGRYIGVFQDVLDRISDINYELLKIRKQLKYLQPKEDGAIMLEFKNCSTDPELFCGGCPHPRFRKWVNPTKYKKSAKSDWVRVEIDQPLKHLKRTGAFTICHPEVKRLISEALGLMEERGRYLKPAGILKAQFTRSSKKREI